MAIKLTTLLSDVFVSAMPFGQLAYAGVQARPAYLNSCDCDSCNMCDGCDSCDSSDNDGCYDSDCNS